jgi:hypothetical protein
MAAALISFNAKPAAQSYPEASSDKPRMMQIRQAGAYSESARMAISLLAHTPSQPGGV